MSTSSILSNNTDYDNHDIVLTESSINVNKSTSSSLTTTTTTSTHGYMFNGLNTKTVINTNSNSNSSNNSDILDAGSELDPNDVHKLPNIYEE
jgi:hypothetical protein